MEHETLETILNYSLSLAMAEAGFYVVKSLGYRWLKNFQRERSLEDSEDKLRIVKRGFMLPTPVDFVYLVHKVRSYKGDPR